MYYNCRGRSTFVVVVTFLAYIEPFRGTFATARPKLVHHTPVELLDQIPPTPDTDVPRNDRFPRNGFVARNIGLCGTTAAFPA